MDSCNKLDARVKLEENRLVVDIDESHQKEARIARLTCEFPFQTEAPESSADDEGIKMVESPPAKKRHIIGDSSYFEELSHDLNHKLKMLKAKTRYYEKLELREASQGSSFSIAEELEKEEVEAAINLLHREIADLEARIRKERTRRSDERRPHTVS